MWVSVACILVDLFIFYIVIVRDLFVQNIIFCVRMLSSLYPDVSVIHDVHASVFWAICQAVYDNQYMATRTSGGLEGLCLWAPILEASFCVYFDLYDTLLIQTVWDPLYNPLFNPIKFQTCYLNILCLWRFIIRTCLCIYWPVELRENEKKTKMEISFRKWCTRMKCQISWRGSRQ